MRDRYSQLHEPTGPLRLNLQSGLEDRIDAVTLIGCDRSFTVVLRAT